MSTLHHGWSCDPIHTCKRSLPYMGFPYKGSATILGAVWKIYIKQDNSWISKGKYQACQPQGPKNRDTHFAEPPLPPTTNGNGSNYYSHRRIGGGHTYPIFFAKFTFVILEIYGACPNPSHLSFYVEKRQLKRGPGGFPRDFFDL